MRNRSEKDLDTLTSGRAGKDSTLAKLLSLSDRYAVLDAKIQGVLSPRLQTQVQVAQIKDQTLFLVARSSAWVARAQLEAPTILQTAQQGWDEPITQIKVVVGANTG